MSETEDRGIRGVSADARTRFAELLRRTERNGERIRLTRRGVPIAYIVPLNDGEKLRHYDAMSVRASDDQPGLTDDAPELPELSRFDPEPEEYKTDFRYDHGDETERDVAITAFKKTVMRILTDTHELKRHDIRDKFKDDNYIATAVRKVIGTGGR